MNPQAPFPEIEFPQEFRWALVAFLICFGLYQGWMLWKEKRKRDERDDDDDKPNTTGGTGGEREVREKWDRRRGDHGLYQDDENVKRWRA